MTIIIVIMDKMTLLHDTVTHFFTPFLFFFFFFCQNSTFLEHPTKQDDRDIEDRTMSRCNKLNLQPENNLQLKDNLHKYFLFFSFCRLSVTEFNLSVFSV